MLHCCIVCDLHLTFSLLQRHQRCLIRPLVLLFCSQQISLSPRFNSRNLFLPFLLLLRGCCCCFMRARAQLSNQFLVFLQLQKQMPLLLLGLGPQRRVSIAKARYIFRST